MTKYFHIKGREACPFLPEVADVIRPIEARLVRETESPLVYYQAALKCAQSLWLEGKPAQALLQLNHGLSLSEVDGVSAYEAKVWFFQNRHMGGFLGNPVRHYQHLATRVSGGNKELRSWRAWTCYYLAQKCLPEDEFPPDQQQIDRESLVIPMWQEVVVNIRQLSSEYEVTFLEGLFSEMSR